MNVNDPFLYYRADGNNNLEVMRPQVKMEHEGNELSVAVKPFINIYIVMVGAW